MMNTTLRSLLTPTPASQPAKVLFSEEVDELKQSLSEALYITLSPGTIPSGVLFLFDWSLTILHFYVSHYILFDFTTTFLGTVYFPGWILKVIYIIELFYTSQSLYTISESIFQIFFITIIISCIAYNFMCFYVTKYRKNIPLNVARAVFFPIVLIGTVIVVTPKIVLIRVNEQFVLFVIQIFGCVCLLVQQAANIIMYFANVFDVAEEKKELEQDDIITVANEVVSNANGRLIWANVFSFVLICFTSPIIVDLYVPLTISWVSWHFLIQSIAQLIPLLLSLLVFLLLPTYRSTFFTCFAGYKKIEAAMEKLKEKEKELIAQTSEPSLAEPEKEKEKEPPHMIPNIVPHYPHHHPAMPPPTHYSEIAHAVQTAMKRQNEAKIRIFVTPTHHQHFGHLPTIQ